MKSLQFLSTAGHDSKRIRFKQWTNQIDVFMALRFNFPFYQFTISCTTSRFAQYFYLFFSQVFHLFSTFHGDSTHRERSTNETSLPGQNNNENFFKMLNDLELLLMVSN